MARDRDDRGTRYRGDDEYLDQDRDRRHRRRHKDRDSDEADKRERRERRRAEEAKKAAEQDINDLRARRESYHSKAEPERRRASERMAKETRREPVKEKPRSSQKDVRRDSTRKPKRREIVGDYINDDFVFGRPKERGYVEEVTVRQPSVRKRNDESGSSNRTAYTPLSGSGSASVRRVEVPALSRNASVREPRESRESREPRESNRPPVSRQPSGRRASTTKVPPPATPTRSQSIKETARKSTGGILSSFFKPSIQRTASAPVRKEEKRVDCLVCMNDDLPVNKTVKLACGHRMCNSCLKRQFTLSVQDPQHMPPRCCTTEHIPLKYAERLFDDKFKNLWNRKYQEYTTANRLYCPTKECGQWIKPSKIRVDTVTNRKYARCTSCSTKVCVLCNNKFHTKRECPKDDETNRFEEMAKAEGWQRCYSCKAVVELKEGCNHMTCRCTAQFCMVCAAPWKTCNCPWFNYQHVADEDRLDGMRVPYNQPYPDVEVIEIMEDAPPPISRRGSTRPRTRGDRDTDRTEHRLSSRDVDRAEHRLSSRDVDRADPRLLSRNGDRAEHRLSSHLRSQLNVNSTPATSVTARGDAVGQVYGIGNAGGHHMNDSYNVRHLATPVSRTATRQPAPAPVARQPAPAPRQPAPAPLQPAPAPRQPAPAPRPAPPRSSFFSSTRRTSAPAVARHVAPVVVSSSAMAGLSKDGKKIGANRVGTWLSHIQVDPEATNSAPKDVEVDDWRCDGTMIGID